MSHETIDYRSIVFGGAFHRGNLQQDDDSGELSCCRSNEQELISHGLSTHGVKRPT
jgi:hypothetical protein